MNYIYRHIIKPFFDFLFATLLLLVFSPIFIIISIILTITYKGSPFFTQKRPGKNEHIFKILKFKTMTDEKDANGKLLSDAQRLTPIGKILRKTSLDELPQILNVIKGEMSFIGPRPLLVKYLPYYTKTEAKRHTVKPGLTGLAQVSGRNFLNWDERLQKDVDYVNNLSLYLDISIFFKTVKKVVLRSDIVVDPTKIMDNLAVHRDGLKNNS